MNEGSFPKELCFGNVGEDLESDASGGMSSETKPRILLMGRKRSGKSSIQKVVFCKMAPSETVFLPTTPNLLKEDISNSTFIQFQIWDFPGQLMEDFDRSEYQLDLEMLFGSLGALVFVIDAMDEYVEALKNLRQMLTAAYKINPSLDFEVFIHKADGINADIKMELQRDIMQSVSGDLTEDGLDELRITYHLTSIYDHSIYEAFSKVVQKIIPQLPTLENLLDIFIANSGIEKVFIFDVISKIYIATDSSPVEMQSYELCCDMIDVVLDVSCIYGENLDDDNSGFDSESSSIIKLNNQTTLYLRELNRHLAIVCILRSESFERRGLIDYNFMCLRRAIKEVFSIGKKPAEEQRSLLGSASPTEPVPIESAAAAKQ